MDLFQSPPGAMDLAALYRALNMEPGTTIVSHHGQMTVIHIAKPHAHKLVVELLDLGSHLPLMDLVLLAAHYGLIDLDPPGDEAAPLPVGIPPRPPAPMGTWATPTDLLADDPALREYEAQVSYRPDPAVLFADPPALAARAYQEEVAYALR